MNWLSNVSLKNFFVFHLNSMKIVEVVVSLNLNEVLYITHLMDSLSVKDRWIRPYTVHLTLNLYTSDVSASFFCKQVRKCHSILSASTTGWWHPKISFIQCQVVFNAVWRLTCVSWWGGKNLIALGWILF